MDACIAFDGGKTRDVGLSREGNGRDVLGRRRPETSEGKWISLHAEAPCWQRTRPPEEETDEIRLGAPAQDELQDRPSYLPRIKVNKSDCISPPLLEDANPHLF